MIKIQLTLKQLKLLEKCLKIDDINNINFQCSLFFNNIQEIETVIDNINDCFMHNGLEKDYEPNEKGIELENLQDVFLKAIYNFEKSNK